MSETLTYKLQTDMQTFEGPLDLLLHLIAKNKMDIFQIQITVIFAQYMQYLDQMPANEHGDCGRIYCDGIGTDVYQKPHAFARDPRRRRKTRVNVWRRRCWNTSAQNERRDIWKNGMFVTAAGR